MSTGAIIAIVIGAVVLVGLLVLLARRGRERRLESRRVEATEHRSEARVRARTADREQADADEAAARAKKARAAAEEQAAVARRAEADAEAKADHAHHERTQAEELHGRAGELDPDAGDPQAEDTTANGAGRGRFDRDANDQRDERTMDSSPTNQVPAQQDRTTR